MLYTRDQDPIVGHSFETFVTEEIIKGLEATLVTNWDVTYFRTKGGAEIDLILDGPFGILPIEIKHGSMVPRRNLTTITKFVKDYNLPFGIVVNQGDAVRWLSREIIQIPVSYI